MKKRFIYVSAIIFPLISFSAQSAPYGLMFDLSSKDRVQLYDVESVVKNGGIVKLWIKEINREPSNIGVSSTMSRLAIDCDSRTIQMMAVNFYGSDRKIMKSLIEPRPKSDVIPDSRGATLLKIACSPKFPHLQTAVGMTDDPYMGAETYFEIATNK